MWSYRTLHCISCIHVCLNRLFSPLGLLQAREEFSPR